jgi:hypothetical protein
MAYNQVGGGLSKKTIQKMKSKGASSDDINFAQSTQHSLNPDHVRIHRSYIKHYNPYDPWREPNNFIMHPADYQFGPGQRSPQYIGGFIEQHGPMYITAPPFMLPPQIAPHVVFRPW